MALSKHKLGEFVETFTIKCNINNLSKQDISGINKNKEFFEPSPQVGSDTSKYKVVKPGCFACNLMHVGRDKVLPIAENTSDKDKYVSPAYTTFSFKANTVLLKEYFFIKLKCNELDRFFWFNTDGSVRDGMNWIDFCNVEIELPPLSVQKKYVAIYNAMVENQKAYEYGIEDLKLVCDAYIEELRRNIPCEKISSYIIRRDERNKDNSIMNVKSVSVLKEFNTPSSKVNIKNLKNYKIVEPEDIAFVQTTHNEKLLCCAVNNTNEQILVSSVNEVFSTNEKLDSNYLMLFLSRKEFDRYARYHSWGSVRETFNWDDMKNVEIPIPDIKIQKSIANVYKVYMQRKEINKTLKAQIKDICPILIKGSLEEGKNYIETKEE